MSVYDIRLKEEWQKILDNIYQELGMPAAVLDEKNIILEISGERNALCSKIRSIKESFGFICGQTQQFMAETARVKKKPVIDLCEAGLSKFIIPLFSQDEWAGSITACGSSIPGEEIEDFVIALNTKMSEQEISRLKHETPEVEQSKVVRVVNRLFNNIQRDI